jgi:hypothetical protein
MLSLLPILRDIKIKGVGNNVCTLRHGKSENVILSTIQIHIRVNYGLIHNPRFGVNQAVFYGRKASSLTFFKLKRGLITRAITTNHNWSISFESPENAAVRLKPTKRNTENCECRKTAYQKYQDAFGSHWN